MKYIIMFLIGVIVGYGFCKSTYDPNKLYGNSFCEGLYLGVLGSTHQAFEYGMVKQCSEEEPELERLIDDNVRAIHSNDYCKALAIFGDYNKLDDSDMCESYTCNPDGEMTGMVIKKREKMLNVGDCDCACNDEKVICPNYMPHDFNEFCINAERCTINEKGDEE